MVIVLSRSELWIGRQRQRMQIDDAEDVVVGVLLSHPVSDRAEIIPDVTHT